MSPFKTAMYSACRYVNLVGIFCDIIKGGCSDLKYMYSTVADNVETPSSSHLLKKVVLPFCIVIVNPSALHCVWSAKKFNFAWPFQVVC